MGGYIVYSRDTTNGMSDKHLSLVNICHIVGTVRSCQHRSAVSLARPSEDGDRCQRNHQYLYDVETCCSVPTARLSSTIRRVSSVCVHIQYCAVRRVVKYTSRRNATTMTRSAYGKCNQPRICYINRSYEFRDSCSLDSFA